MDTSKVYLRMCEEANKYIGKTSLSYGDYYWHNGDWHIHTESGSSIPVEPFTPLYRQDQLQEMLGDYDYCLELLGDNYKWCFKVAQDVNYYNFASMEQLWLAFVMKEKYNKVWNGKTREEG